MAEIQQPLITKYRPETFDELIGHDPIVDALKRAIASSSRPHSYLMTGPAGTGKTTTARLIASHLECSDVMEIDAASNSGIDAMRELVELGNHMSLTGDGNRAFIVDECFAPNTQIDTPNGLRPISSISEGDEVLGVFGPNKVNKILVNRVNVARIVQLRLANGKRILCSEDHAFLTKKGWVAAKDMGYGQSVFKQGSDIHASMQGMWDNIYEQGRGRKILRNLQAQKISSHMRRVWGGVSFRSLKLFSGMWLLNCCPETYGGTPGSMAGGYEPCPAEGGEGTARFSHAFFRANVEAQPYAQSICHKQNGRNKTEEWNPSPKETLAGRKWQAVVQSTSNAFRQIGMQIRIRRAVENGQEVRIPSLLQNRLGLPRFEVGDRGRWTNPQFPQTNSIGSKEGSDANTIRVESVAFYEQGSGMLDEHGVESYTIGDQEFVDFYDLEVAGHPSYSTEGILVHNCHALSKSAWQAILKLLEEPPKHLFLMLCTTELQKVPETIRQRCYHVAYRPLKPDALGDYLDVIAELEGWNVANDVMAAVIQNANGSPRKALSMLQTVHDVSSREEVNRIIALNDASDPLIDICQMLLRGGTSWKMLAPAIAKLDDADIEEGLIGAGRYIAAAMTRSKSEKDARRAWQILEAITFPTITFDKKVQFLTAIGRLIFTEGTNDAT